MISEETFQSPVFARLEAGINDVKETREPEGIWGRNFPSKGFKGIKFLSGGSSIHQIQSPRCGLEEKHTRACRFSGGGRRDPKESGVNG